MNIPKYTEVQQIVDVAGYKMQSEFLNFLHK